MNVLAETSGAGLVFGIASLVGMIASRKFSTETSVDARWNLAFGLSLASAAVGFSAVGRSLAPLSVIVLLFGSVIWSICGYGSFERVRRGWIIPLLLVVVMTVGGATTGSWNVLLDALVCSIPFGATAWVLRSRHVFIFETAVCAAAGSFIGLGLGLAATVAGVAICVSFFRKPDGSPYDLPFARAIACCVIGLVIFTTVSSV